MDDREVGRYWESNARAWTTLSRQGWDVYRDTLNTPAFLELLPEIGGHSGLDIGCGDGHNTRLLAARGARMAGIDLAPTFVEYAREAERENPLGIQDSIGSARDLPFASERFDFAAAFMSLMDMPEPEAALREAWRVLRPVGIPAILYHAPVLLPAAPTTGEVWRIDVREQRIVSSATQLGSENPLRAQVSGVVEC